MYVCLLPHCFSVEFRERKNSKTVTLIFLHGLVVLTIWLIRSWILLVKLSAFCIFISNVVTAYLQLLYFIILDDRI